MKRQSVKLRIKTNHQNFTKKEKIISDFILENPKEASKMTKQELMAKNHLESTTDITANMGYINLKNQNEITEKAGVQKERE